MPSPMQIIWLVKGTSSLNAVMSHMPTRSKFQTIQFATVVFIKEDARPTTLDIMIASHFAFASSHLLRGTDLLHISGLNFLKKLNSFLDFFIASILSSTTKGSLGTSLTQWPLDMTSIVKMSYCFCVVFTLCQVWCWKHVVSTTDTSKNTLSRAVSIHHLELWGFKPPLCQGPGLSWLPTC